MSHAHPLSELSQAEREQLTHELERDYGLVQANKIALDLSRGKPAADQLELSHGMEEVIAGDYRASDGTDVRNYGGIRGIPEIRALGAELMSTPAEQVMAGGNSSLNLMHLAVSTALNSGLWGDERRWRNHANPKILTPVPGYDRHFVLTEALGIGMQTIGMLDTGPDMAAAQAAVAEDASIKGIWCVPKYSNPTGCTYDQATVDAIAQLPNVAKADDFVVLWDNAYAVHDLEFPGEVLPSLTDAAARHGTSDHMVQFASTSKITFAGAGVAFLATSENVLSHLESQLAFQTIGPDKVNQLRHARFLSGRLDEHMRAHAELLIPKFKIVLETLAEELGGLGIATWTEPKGGYFISLDVPPGQARRVIGLAKDVGLTLTPAGAPFPYGDDPEDKNIRIAPTFASLSDLKAAMQILTLCVKLAALTGDSANN